MPRMTTLGRERVKKGLTQRDLGRMIGQTMFFINSLEVGAETSWATANHIADVLDVPVDDLVSEPSQVIYEPEEEITMRDLYDVLRRIEEKIDAH